MAGYEIESLICEGPESRIEENQIAHPELNIPVSISIGITDMKGIANQVG